MNTHTSSIDVDAVQKTLFAAVSRIIAGSPWMVANTNTGRKAIKDFRNLLLTTTATWCAEDVPAAGLNRWEVAQHVLGELAERCETETRRMTRTNNSGWYTYHVLDQEKSKQAGNLIDLLNDAWSAASAMNKIVSQPEAAAGLTFKSPLKPR